MARRRSGLSTVTWCGSALSTPPSSRRRKVRDSTTGALPHWAAMRLRGSASGIDPPPVVNPILMFGP
jgi:hypothetical protein